MASTIHEPSSQCSNRTCIYYPKIHYVVDLEQRPQDELEPSATLYELFFPRSCSQCSTLRIKMDKLCPFCHHLRLEHLLYCLRDVNIQLTPCLALGRLADLQLRPGCTFCTFILQIVGMESQTSHVNVVDSDFVMLSPNLYPRILGADIATPLVPSDADPTVQVYSGYQHTNIESFMADKDWCLFRVLDAKLYIRRRWPPDEPNTMGEIVNWQRLRTCIRDCMDHHIHSGTIHTRKENILGSLLFIDVEKGCIVSAPSSCDHIALSYVWGDHTTETIQTTKQSIDNFRKVGSLMDLRIPATIRDAMIACRLLGVQYLWVDRFCIVQDDELQKHDQILSMGMIYSCALLTICATAGNNAEYGLPGVQSKPRAQFRPRTFAFGVEVVSGRRSDKSTWSTRGWTYQEMVLSRRRLVFTDEEVFFECDRGTSAEVTTPIEPTSRHVSLNGFDTKVECYMNHVEHYTTRNLSFRSDVYNAFAGICGSIYPSKDLIQSLPTSAFDDAILWEASGMDKDDDEWPRQILGNDLYVPSWSWASAFGHSVKYNSRYPVIGSFAKWSFVEQQDQVRVIESADTPMGWDFHWHGSCYDPRLYLALAWREHVIESTPSFTICWDQPFVDIESLVIKGWLTYRDYWEEAHGGARIETNVQTELVGKLLLRTSVAFFRLAKQPTYDGGRVQWVIYSDDGFPCGWVDLPLAATNEEIPVRVKSCLMSGRRKVQLVALSCTHCNEFQFRKLFDALSELSKENGLASSSGPESRFHAMESKTGDSSSYHKEYLTPETTYYDSTNSPLDPVPGIRVMMICWRGDVAYRVGLGVVLLRQWKKGNPTFRTIILE